MGGGGRVFRRAAARRAVAGVLGTVLLGCAGAGRTGGRTPAASPAPTPSPTPSAEAPPLPVASDAAADSLLVELVRVVPGLRLDIRYATANNFTGAVLPGYDAPRAYLRREAAAALARVQAALRADGLGLLVFDAYRPVRASVGMVTWAERAGRMNLITDGYVARRSRHNLGLAIDLTLVDLATGTPLDMGTPFDFFGAAAHTANASGAVAEHRQRLVQAMTREGFANYDQEWWHFAYTVPDPMPFDRVIGPAPGD